MPLDDRKKRILRATVENYIETAEPVGSKAIAQSAGLGLSSATIRNEMAELESMGYLEQPHTSAGRIPTPLGYRIYVNELMFRQKLSVEEAETISSELQQKMEQLDMVISDAGRLASQLTNYPTYTLATAAQSLSVSRFDLIYIDEHTFIVVAMLNNQTVKNRLMKLPLVIKENDLTRISTVFNANFTGVTDENITSDLISATQRAAGDDIGLVSAIAGFTIETLNEAKKNIAHISGTSHILEHPEFQDPTKAQKLLSYLSDNANLTGITLPESGDTKIMIGPENIAEELKDSSVVMARYDTGDGMHGLIGVVGPTRMDYAKVSARLEYIARTLSKLPYGGAAMPGLAPHDEDEDKD